ncbi:MAG: hypothetical protein ABI858_04925 [Pseudoxanthomonas sp.]
MPACNTRLLTNRLGSHDFRIHALSDRQQVVDPTAQASSAGVALSLTSVVRA